MLVHIVDDDESVRKGLTRLLRSAGFECQAYATPEGFLAEVHNEDIACILIDITMPGMNGLQLVGQLKEMGITYPAIAISAHDDNVRNLARDIGIRFFLRKPVDDQALIDAINWVMHEDECRHIPMNRGGVQ